MRLPPERTRRDEELVPGGLPQIRTRYHAGDSSMLPPHVARDRIRTALNGLPLPRRFLDVPRVMQWVTSGGLWLLVLLATLPPHRDIPLRTLWELGLVVALFRTAIALVAGRRPIPPDLVGLSWAMDAVLLSGLLKLTGGPFNPFLLTYGVYVWLAVVQASARWGVFTGIVAAAGFGLFVVDHLHTGQEHHRLNDLPTHLLTIWLSAVAVTELVAHYVRRARAALEHRQALLDEAHTQVARSEQLASLTALAAGAAHELSTPLATIAVVARELERNAARASASTDAITALEEDARLIRVEVERCRVILDSMSGRASTGQSVAAATPAPASEVARLAQERLSETQRARLRIEIAPGVPMPMAGSLELSQAIMSLLTNAFDATEQDGPVDLRVFPYGPMVRVQVEDHGPGLSPEAIRRVGEPFFTTKAGRGLGLGVFLVRAFAERVGGTLRFENHNGTTAILDIPASESPVLS